jgi:hypothetical protein
VTAALDSFAAAARQYCAWCQGPALPARAEARTAYNLLVALLAAMSRVESVEPGDIEIDYDRDYPRMRDRFSSLPFQYYRSDHNPLNVDETGPAAIGDVIDDLADIWLDLECGLKFYDVGDRATAAWHWHLMFESHWGRHATAALYALHCWLVDSEDTA